MSNYIDANTFDGTDLFAMISESNDVVIYDVSDIKNKVRFLNLNGLLFK